MSLGLIVFWVCVSGCLIGQAAILRSVVRSRSVTADANVPRPKLLVEVGWALLPAIVLTFVLAATWPQVRYVAASRAAVTTEGTP